MQRRAFLKSTTILLLTGTLSCIPLLSDSTDNRIIPFDLQKFIAKYGEMPIQLYNYQGRLLTYEEMEADNPGSVESLYHICKYLRQKGRF